MTTSVFNCRSIAWRIFPLILLFLRLILVFRFQTITTIVWEQNDKPSFILEKSTGRQRMSCQFWVSEEFIAFIIIFFSLNYFYFHTIFESDFWVKSFSGFVANNCCEIFYWCVYNGVYKYGSHCVPRIGFHRQYIPILLFWAKNIW